MPTDASTGSGYRQLPRGVVASDHRNNSVGVHLSGPGFVVRRFEQPQFTPSYDGSASVMAIELANAAASSSGPCGICR